MSDTERESMEFDVVIVGAGGHGLGAAYYLAREHGITNVAVIDKGWLGGGNTGRNTTIIRSNYLYDESARLFDHAVDLWEGLSQELNYNVMYSRRGVLMLAHNVHDVQSFQRHIHANRLNGVDNRWLTTQECKDYCPPLNISANARYPVMGGALQEFYRGFTDESGILEGMVLPTLPGGLSQNSVTAGESGTDYIVSVEQRDYVPENGRKVTVYDGVETLLAVSMVPQLQRRG